MAAKVFVGKWQLDLDKSEPITPMLEALKVNPVYRKASLQLQVTQDISLLPSDPQHQQQQLLRICNKSSFGTSITTQLLNGGNQPITDPKTREISVYNAKLDANAEFPISIFCELPNQTGFTKDHRRLLDGGREMEQKIEFRASRSSMESVVMRRYWTRIGPVPAVIVEEEEEQVAKVTTVLPVANNQQQVIPQDLLDWPGMCVLFGFVSLTMMVGLYVDCTVCLSALGYWRLGSEQQREEAKIAMAGAGQFGLVPVVLGLTTRLWFASSWGEHRAATMVLSMVALAWTQRERLANAHQIWIAGRLFALSTSTEQADSKVLAKYWMELCGVLVAVTLVATTTTTMGGGLEIVPMAALYALTRYRLDVAFRPLPVITTTTPPQPEPKPLAISVTESRLTVDPHTGKCFAQYLVRVDQMENWVRYSDLLTCYGDIRNTHIKFKAVTFPPKIWNSTSDSVMASRVNELNETFIALATLGEEGTNNTLLQVHTFRQFVLGEDQHVPQPIAQRRLAIGQVLRAYELINEHSQVGSGLGWELVDPNRRIYLRSGGNRQYKQVLFLPHLTVRQAVEWIRTNNRSLWDREFQGEVTLGVRVEEKGERGGVLEISHKRVFWSAGDGQAQVSEVLQACLYGKSWVEVALPQSSSPLEGFTPRAAQVTGFVFQPAGGGEGCVATYITSSAVAAFKFAPVTLKQD
ncbi:hypothetical protein BASA81_005477 [Batrachochytrium salamandrivorans]|nr:hypothetical protein BASA81_005477 [Batrachochytrium salamandrivorans]